jgi:hypothetical protein
VSRGEGEDAENPSGVGSENGSWSTPGARAAAWGDSEGVWVTRTPHLERGTDHTKKGKAELWALPIRSGSGSDQFIPVQQKSHPH